MLRNRGWSDCPAWAALADANRAAGADNYLTAATQSAFLQAYGGVGVAAEAAALAERARSALPAWRRRNPRRRRREQAACAPAAPDGGPGGVAEGEHAPGNLPWADVDQIDLQAELRRPVPTLQDAPPFLLRRALVFALRAIRDADAAESAHVTPARAWSLFLLTSRAPAVFSLSASTGTNGASGPRCWPPRRRPGPAHSKPSRGGREAALRQRREAACRLVHRGEVSRAPHLLTSGTLVLGDEATWEALTDPAKHPAQARTPVPNELFHWQPGEPARITARAIAQTLREANHGAAPGLSGARAEQSKLLLSAADGLELLMHAASVLAQARAPPAVAAALALARMTALQKPDGGVRGIATGNVFRRPVSRALAKTWAATFDNATRPYQYALIARTGMDALVACLRIALETDPDVTAVSLDGRSAYDTVSRAAFLRKLHQVGPALLPFVRLFYMQPSVYCWWDATGTCRDIHQAEGCEQGDALAPALFLLGQHDSGRGSVCIPG